MATRFGAGDLWGGGAAAAVLLPQSIAFGVALLALAGADPAAGAYAGLITGVALCLASGFVGRTEGLISGPTGPALVLLGGAVTALAAAGLAGPALLAGLTVTVVVAGLLQFLLGLSGGGRVIKYIPFPVVSGFMTGSAFLMIKSQLGPLGGPASGAAWVDWRWLPAAAAVVTIAGVKLLPRWLPRVPGPVAGLVLGTAAFHALAAWHGGAPPAAWLIGVLPGFGAARIGLPVADLARLPWAALLPSAAALAVLASLNTLLTSVVADVATGARHDARRELMAQGLGQAAAGLLGGMGGSATTAATATATRFGGRRWAAPVAGGVLLLTGFAGEAGRLLPIGALAGVILAVAIDVADRDILTWARNGRTRLDAAIAVAVTLITVFIDLVSAIGVGVGVAILLFIREQVRAPVVHRRSTAHDVRSIRERPEAERTLIDTNGERIVLYELRGNLFFGTADRLLDELGPDLDGPHWIVLHLRKVTRVDLTAIRFLQQIARRLAEHGGLLLCCEVHSALGIGTDVGRALAEAGGRGAPPPVLTFNGRDEALEFAEDALLAALEYAPTRLDQDVPLGENAICRELSAAEVEHLRARLTRRDVARGATLFAAGEASNELYLVERGQFEIQLDTTAHHYKRLAVYGPGSFFGELALLKGGTRAARAVASTNSRLWVLDRATFDALKRAEPALAIGLLSALADTLVTHQRWSTRELKRLSEW